MIYLQAVWEAWLRPLGEIVLGVAVGIYLVSLFACWAIFPMLWIDVHPLAALAYAAPLIAVAIGRLLDAIRGAKRS